MAETKATVVLISKMSVKTLKCKPELAKIDEKPVVLCRIYGKAVEVKPQEDKVTGQVFYPIIGLFEGVNLASGETFRSGKLFLPKGIHEMVESATKKLDAKDPSAFVAFALEISAVPASNPIGYSYEAKNLIKTEVADELETMRDALPEFKQSALPAAKGK